jgi:acyl transferase domain-containing protein
MGESAAACVAGALSVADACAVICRRSALAKQIRGRGGMAWVGLSAEAAAEAIARRESAVAVAAAAGDTVVVEMSPHPLLVGAVRETAPTRDWMSWRSARCGGSSPLAAVAAGSAHPLLGSEVPASEAGTRV